MGWQGPCVPRWHLLHTVGTGEGGGLRDGVELGVDPSDGLSLGEGDTDGVTDMLDVTDTVGDGEGVMDLVAVGVGQQRP